MKLSIGYQLPDEDDPPFSEQVSDYTDSTGEVYFPWPGAPSGRSAMGARDGFVDWKGQEKLLKDLKAFKDKGIALNLLFNANCYGGGSLSGGFKNYIVSIIEHLSGEAGIDGVTTSSLMVAHTVKEHFPPVKTRASVNMRIGTVNAMNAVSDLFDGFCIHREFNRDLERVGALRKWADESGKELVMLANSGCINFCPGQVFHDNLVAHEDEISRAKNIENFNPLVCWRHYRERKNWPGMLHNSSWIRPEDICNYEPYFNLIKLATRMHSNPVMVIDAYSKRKFYGNLVDLLEPAHNPLLAPHIIDNTRFPEDWFEKSSACDRNSCECEYCSSVLERVLQRCGG